MKVAVATDGNAVAQHFGRCQQYTLADIEDGKVLNKEVVSSPGHQPGFLPRFLAEKGVSCVIAGGMGPKAQNLFSQHNVQTIIGVTGTVDETLEAFVKGQLQSGESLCDHPHGEHGDGHCHHG